METAILIPTKDRPELLAESLREIELSYPNSRVFIADSSTAPLRIEDLQKSAPSLRFRAQHYDPDISLPEKLIRSTSKINQQFIFICGDDDFIVGEFLHVAERILKEDREVNIVSGRTSSVSRRAGGGADVRTMLIGSNLHETPHQRLYQSMAGYSPTIYSLWRTEAAQETFRVATEVAEDINLWEISTAILPSFGGKRYCTQLHSYVRQSHAANMGKGRRTLVSVETDLPYRKELRSWLNKISAAISPQNRGEVSTTLKAGLNHYFAKYGSSFRFNRVGDAPDNLAIPLANPIPNMIIPQDIILRNTYSLSRILNGIS